MEPVIQLKTEKDLDKPNMFMLHKNIRCLSRGQCATNQWQQHSTWQQGKQTNFQSTLKIPPPGLPGFVVPKSHCFLFRPLVHANAKNFHLRVRNTAVEKG